MYLVRHWNPLGHILAALSFCGLVVGCGDERISADRLSADRPPVLESVVEPLRGHSPALAMAEQKNSKVAPAADKAVKAREVVFKDWPKPQVVLVVTGRQNGYLEPCGCTGLANQKGGLARRHTLLLQLEKQGWPVVPLDVGNQVQRSGQQAEIKFQIAIEALKKMRYKAIGLGPDDLRLSTGDLVAAVTDAPSPFVGVNAAIIDPEYTPALQIVSAGGKKIGVTAVLGAEHQKKINSDEIVLSPPADKIKAVLPELKNAKCDLYVLLAHASLDESRQLAKQFPDFQIVVTAGGADEPPFEPEIVANTKTLLVQVGAKGMYVGVIGVFADAARPFRYQRVPLDDRYADSRDMLQLMKNYQGELEAAGLEGLGVKPLAHPSGRKFVGSEKCGDCHTKSFEVWQKTPHAQATESLVHPGERTEIPRHHDPECLSCHVTGWEPQKFFPLQTGYLGLKTSPLLHGSGCENCHGPGSAHVAAETEGQADEAKLAKLRQELRLPLAKAEQKCVECHDLNNSPAFHKDGAFEKYWKQVEHVGKD